MSRATFADLTQPLEDFDGEDTSDNINDGEPLTQEDVWEVVTAFFAEKGLVNQQLDSFNNFMLVGMPRIIRELRPLEVASTHQRRPGEDPRSYREIRYIFEMRNLITSMPQDQTELPLGGEETVFIYPHDCRLRRLTYEGGIMTDVIVKRYIVSADGTETLDKNIMIPRVDLGNIPVMLKSKWCNLTKTGETEMPYMHECLHDQGGYFVVKGTEKVMIAQERAANNHVNVFTLKANVNSHSSEVRSCIEGSYRAPSVLKVFMQSDSRCLRVFHKNLGEQIPLFAMQKALNCTTDKDIIETCVYNIADTEMVEQLQPSMEDGKEFLVPEQALIFIGRRWREDAVHHTNEEQVRLGRQFLQNVILPHVGVEDGCETRKSYFLGYMVHRLLLVALGRREQDDRDFYGNKRMDMCGSLLGQLFQTILANQVHKRLKAALQREISENKSDIQVRDLFKRYVADPLTENFRYSLATGNWGTKGSEGMKTGVSQVLNRLTYSSALSHLRRLNTPIDSSSKQTRPRMLHCTQWGIMCPAETPEGGQCGLVKNLSLLSLASVGTDPSGVIRWLEQNGTEPLVECTPASLARPSAVKIFVNGNWIGVHNKGGVLAKTLKSVRRNRTPDNPIDGDTSVVLDIRDKELRIWTDSGRPLRPIFVVENNKIVLTRNQLEIVKADVKQAKHMSLWNRIVNGPFIDYLDVEEEDTCLIAMSPSEMEKQNNQYTHCEIHPSLILGICASIIPFSDHNPGTRNTYQSAMGKQAMGIYASNYQLRFDTTAHVLYYPQKPMCRTKAMGYMHSNDLPAGHNAVVAIMCYSGYNQEDSVVMNQSSIDRGFFRSSYYQGYECQQESNEQFEKPDKAQCKRRRNLNYEIIDSDGMAIPGMPVCGADVIFGKTIPNDQLETDVFIKRDKSEVPKPTELGIIDSVLLTETITNTGATQRMGRVKVRRTRIPNVGDKFCSRHGQKGTIGITYRMEDMPFNQAGMVPDIIINPHAIPSRMTVAHLVETLAGKSGCYEGQEVDSTAFLKEVTVQNVAEKLHSLKYQRWGNERLHNGHTGLPIDALVFIGPTYYQRLRHISMDKIHARPRGSVLTLNRQPKEGRAALGGGRFGEMERDCMIAHGASQWLKERLFHVSDHYRVMVCDVCGMMSPEKVTMDYDTNTPVYTCRACGVENKLSKVMIPYACKLLFQELMSMSIWLRIRTEKI